MTPPTRVEILEKALERVAKELTHARTRLPEDRIPIELRDCHGIAIAALAAAAVAPLLDEAHEGLVEAMAKGMFLGCDPRSDPWPWEKCSASEQGPFLDLARDGLSAVNEHARKGPT